MSSGPRIAGLVLAAGAGTRYGMPKVRAAQGDWLRRAVVALAGGGCTEVVVVLGAAVVTVPEPARAVHAADWADGMSASLRTGLVAVSGADLVVVHLVDLPDVGADVVARVLAAVGRTGLARAVYGGRPGHPVVFAAGHLDALTASLHGVRGARDFLAAHAAAVVAVECGDLAGGVDRDTR